jgi:uncharacterized protein (TIGR02996 family)
MTDRDAFLKTIIENPEEDTPRLVFADWLEEQGEPRGEFIRIQCALAHMEMNDDRLPELIAREQALLLEHGDEWLGRLKLMVDDYCFRRGFVERVSLQGRHFLGDAVELFERAPIRELGLTHLGMGRFPATELAAVTQLTRLNTLELSGVAGDERINTILQSKHLKQITRLQLDNVRCGKQALETIFGGNFPRLAALELIGDELGAYSRIVCSPKISLREYSIKSMSGALNRDDVIKLARAKNLAGLTVLDLRESKVQVPGATAIANSKVLKNLQVVGLRGCSIGVHGMQALGQSGNMAGLTALNVGANHFGINGLRGVVGGHWTGLTSLNLANNDLDDRCVPLLLDWPGLSRLRYLNLSGNQIQDAAMAELLGSPELARLWYLDLGSLSSGPKTTEVLNDSPHWAGMKSQMPRIFGFGRFNRAATGHFGNRVNID